MGKDNRKLSKSEQKRKKVTDVKETDKRKYWA